MIWTRQPQTSQTAYQLEAAGAVELGNLKTLYVSGNQHVVITLVSDPKHWHYWFYDAAINHWSLQGTFGKLADARKAGEEYEASLVSAIADDVNEAQAGIATGRQVITARWAVEPYLNEDRDRPIVVPCQTPYTAGIITAILKRLGLAVEIEEVVA